MDAEEWKTFLGEKKVDLEKDELEDVAAKLSGGKYKRKHWGKLTKEKLLALNVAPAQADDMVDAQGISSSSG
jgi:hypothetical protein